MNFYLTDAKVTELAEFTRKQRRFILRGAMEMLRREKPYSFKMMVVLPIFILTFAGCFIGESLSHSVYTNYGLLIMIAVALMFNCVGAFIGQGILRARLRPYFNRYIELNRSDFSKAA